MSEQLIPVSHKDYMLLADAYDKHSRTLMTSKGEEYAIDNDFLAMENRLAGMLGDSPEYVSLVMAGKHITAMGIILEKNDVTKIKLEKWDERIRDATNLLKIASAFVHAKQNDFSLHLGKDDKSEKFVCPAGWDIDIAGTLVGWFVSPRTEEPYRYLHKDLLLHECSTGYNDGDYGYGEAPGYWPTKEEAEAALAAYLEKPKAKGGYCEHCEGKIRRAANGTAVGLCEECSKL